MATRTKRRPMTADEIEERESKVKALTAKLTTAVEALAGTGEWLRLLKAMRSFHQYSWRNRLLVFLEAEERGTTVTKLASYGTWKRLGYQVRRGERGYSIIARLERRLSEAEAAKRAAEGKPAYNSDGRPAYVFLGWKIEKTFDIAQCDLMPGHGPIPEQPSWVSQHGDGPEGLLEALCGLIEAEGFTIEMRPPTAADGGAHGWSNGTTKTVWLRDDVDTAEIARVASHELAHIRAEHFTRAISRAQGECEADSIAYVVCMSAGLSIEDSAAPYLVGWAQGDPDVLAVSAETVHKVAAAILSELGGEDTAEDFSIQQK